MSLNAYHIALITGGFGIIIALLTILPNKHFSARRNRTDKFNTAAQSFIAAFTEELNHLKRPQGNPYRILHDAITKHEDAMTVFRQFIPEKRLPAFDIAWKAYYENEQSQNHPLRQYAALVDQAGGLTNQQKTTTGHR